MKLTAEFEKHQTRCISPDKVVTRGTEEMANMFGTHDWDVDYGKPFGETGVLLHYNCKNCDAEGYSVIASKGSPTATLIEKRIINFV